MSIKHTIEEIKKSALIALKDNKIDIAEELYKYYLNIFPGDYECLNNLGVICLRTNSYEKSIEFLNMAIKCNPSCSDAYLNLYTALIGIGQQEEATRNLEIANSLDPNNTSALIGLIDFYNSKKDSRKLQNILDSISRNFIDLAWLIAHLTRKVCNERDQSYDKITLDLFIDTFPRIWQFHFLTGFYLENVDLNLSLKYYTRAKKLSLDNLEVILSLANVYLKLGDHINHLEILNEGSKKYNDVRIYYNLALWYANSKDLNTALDYFKAAYVLDPYFPCLAGEYFFYLSTICNWSESEQVYNFIENNILEIIIIPFNIIHRIEDAILLKIVTQNFINFRWPSNVINEIKLSDATKRIRVGYFSNDFYEHATSYLMANVLELHDKTRFEIFGFDYSPDTNDPMRNRVLRSFDHHIPIAHLTDYEAAEIARSYDLHIAVDLKGFTTESRLGIFSYRVAPIQCHLLGYPGSIGAPYIDYLFGDPYTTPSTFSDFYTEQIVYMPDSYQMNDPHRAIATSIVNRSDFGIPENSFVYCCFNNNFKITQRIFEVWLRILKDSSNTVLWLYEGNQLAKSNLIAYAESLGIDPARLIFATKVPPNVHISRHKLANLFLDTTPYNAHTTASDALWANLPIITLSGNTFSSRVAGSLLNAVGLNKYIMHSDEDYINMAVELSKNSTLYNNVVTEFKNVEKDACIFNSLRYARALEENFISLLEKYVENKRTN